MVEGIRIHNSLKGSKLILSGGAVFDPVPEAKVMADAAYKLGVDPDDIILESASKDTEDQAQNIEKLAQLNQNDKIILVTTHRRCCVRQPFLASMVYSLYPLRLISW